MEWSRFVAAPPKRNEWLYTMVIFPQDYLPFYRSSTFEDDTYLRVGRRLYWYGVMMSKFSGVPLQEWQPHRMDNGRVDGMRAAVIGGTGGLGRAIALWIAAQGAEVTVVGLTFRDAGVARLSFITADHSLMAEARRVADALPAEQLDLLLFTAGIFSSPHRETTPDGLGRDIATSYLNRLVMLKAMAPRLGTARAIGARPVRLFIMAFPCTSQAGDPDDLKAERAYQQFPIYMNTVAGNEALVLHAAHLSPPARLWPEPGAREHQHPRQRFRWE